MFSFGFFDRNIVKGNLFMNYGVELSYVMKSKCYDVNRSRIRGSNSDEWAKKLIVNDMHARLLGDNLLRFSIGIGYVI